MIGAVPRVIANKIFVDDLQKTNQTYNVLLIQGGEEFLGSFWIDVKSLVLGRIGPPGMFPVLCTNQVNMCVE